MKTHADKERLVIETAKSYGIEHFVETGTWLGNMVEAVKDHFETVTSIEICPTAAHNARERFKDDGNVTIICGDSAKILPTVELRGATLFWIDAHSQFGDAYAGCPLEAEVAYLRRLAGYKSDHIVLNHALIIDDLDQLGKHDFPARSLIDDVRQTYHRVDVVCEGDQDVLLVAATWPLVEAAKINQQVRDKNDRPKF